MLKSALPTEGLHPKGIIGNVNKDLFTKMLIIELLVAANKWMNLTVKQQGSE